MGARILVIEDNPINMELMTYLLAAWGHDAIPAADGHTGIALARADPPDLIVCDVQMPGIDGYEVARILKADPGLRRVPLLAVTAYAMVGDAEKALAAGFDGHVSKPIDPPSFMRILDGMLSSPGTQQAPAPANPEPLLAPVPPALRAPLEGLLLLLADDSPVNLEFKVSLLEPAGYRVQCAHDGLRLRVLDGDVVAAP